MNDADISAPTVSRRTERNAARDRLAYILSFVCLGLGVVWLGVVCAVGYPKWSKTHPPEFKKLPEVERARILVQRDQDAEWFVLASIAGVTQPLTAGLAAVFLVGIGLAGLVRFPFLSVISTVGLSLWIFGVAFSRPPPKLVDVKEGTSTDDPIVQYDDMTSDNPTTGKKWTSRSQGLIEFAAAVCLILGLTVARSRIVNGTIRHRRSVASAPTAAAVVSSSPSSATVTLPVADALPVIAAKSISRDFTDGEKVRSVLKDASISVGRGEIIAIVGQSGSGKSTLLHILGLLDTQTSGTVTVRGQDALALPERERDAIRNRTIGFVFQFFHLMADFDVLDNVLTSSRIAGDYSESKRQEAIALIERLGLGDHLHASVGTLSGGERQRVAIARALANKPQVLLCDEPTGNLDDASGRAIMDLLLSLRDKDGLSLVVVTHDAGLADRADRTYILKDGMLTKSEWDAKRDG